MKHLKEKDLSLNKQVISDLSGAADTREETNEVACASDACTDSNYKICCDETEEVDCIASEACISVNDCPVTNDSICNICTKECQVPETEVIC